RGGAVAGPETASPRATAGLGGAGMLGGDAGVPLYSQSQALGGLQDSVNTNRQQERAAKKVAEDPSQPEAKRDEARRQLQRFGEAEEALSKQTVELAGRLNDANFTAGFGSNGGEEFLSYMSISETLLVKGGKAWEQWDQKMTEGLTRAQDKDG